MVSNKMAESVSFATPPVPLEISTGNPAHSWGKWKQKFESYLKAIGAAKKPDEMKVGLLSTTSASRVWKFTQISPSYPSVTTPLEEKTNFQPKIPTTTRPLWQSLINTFKNETLNLCCERNFGLTLNESRHRPLIRGS